MHWSILFIVLLALANQVWPTCHLFTWMTQRWLAACLILFNQLIWTIVYLLTEVFQYTYDTNFWNAKHSLHKLILKWLETWDFVINSSTNDAFQSVKYDNTVSSETTRGVPDWWYRTPVIKYLPEVVTHGDIHLHGGVLQRGTHHCKTLKINGGGGGK